MTKHDSLEDLAEHYKIPLDALKATIEEYNAMAEKGEDTAFKADFAKTKNNKVDKPPYYAVMVKPNLTYSLAGALITPKAEVVSVLDDAPTARPARPLSDARFLLTPAIILSRALGNAVRRSL